MDTVLLVDDEKSLVLSLQAGLEGYKDQFEVLTAHNGKEAVAVLEAHPVDLLVTDLKMPVMDGFELLAYMHTNFPAVPTVVITAFATPEIEQKLDGMIVQLIEKPIDFDRLTEAITRHLAAGSRGGSLSGISLPNFLQLIEMENKTCLLEICRNDERQGLFYFNRGELCDALYQDLVGDDAAFALLNLDDVQINFKSLPKKNIKKRITRELMALILEAARRQDESAAQPHVPFPAQPDDERSMGSDPADALPVQPALDGLTRPEDIHPQTGDQSMSDLTQVLDKFRDIQGFMAVGIFSPNGEMVAEVNNSGSNIAELGALANDVLLKAQKATDIMGVGRGNLVHIQAPKAHVIARCLNEATDFAATAAGKAHVHMVLCMNTDGNVAMGKMKLDAIIQEVASFFR